MTIQEINQALGQEWFKSPNPKANLLLYTIDADICPIDLERVFFATDDGSSRILYEYMGEGELPKTLTHTMEIGEDEDVVVHELNKWEARGCLIIQAVAFDGKA